MSVMDPDSYVMRFQRKLEEIFDLNEIPSAKTRSITRTNTINNGPKLNSIFANVSNENLESSDEQMEQIIVRKPFQTTAPIVTNPLHVALPQVEPEDSYDLCNSPETLDMGNSVVFVNPPAITISSNNNKQNTTPYTKANLPTKYTKGLTPASAPVPVAVNNPLQNNTANVGKSTAEMDDDGGW